MGYDDGSLRRAMASQYAAGRTFTKDGFVVSNAMSEMTKYYNLNSKGSGYGREYENLEARRKKEIEHLDTLLSMKKKDQAAIDDTKQKIAELDEQILFFTEDLARSLWGIDIKNWADQIGDALMNAFINGEDAAKAYEDTVRSIMQNVASEIIKVGLLQPMMENLMDDLFGKVGDDGKRSGGVVSEDMILNNPAEAGKAAASYLAVWYSKTGKAMVEASRQIFVGLDDVVKQGGLSGGLRNPDSSGGLSASVKGITEETAGILAGYVNALRQDVAVESLMLSQFVSKAWPEYIEAYSKNVTSVTNIDNNVRVIMEMMEYGRGAMYQEIAAVGSRLDRVMNGIDSFRVS